MADHSFGHLTQHAYTLQPRRSRIAGVGRWALTCAACLALGAAAAIGYARAPAALPSAPCTAVPQDDKAEQELTRARLALQQEVAARTAVQETADASATEVRRLNEELRFLRSQTQQQPRR
ncbi:MAG: hypothetical protein JSS56_07645 [Proteobacteria bacterium]|nr:hypothetical protein [Pseudomonadota bacterium]